MVPKAPVSSPPIYLLPVELAREVAEYLPQKDKRNLRAVSSFWRDIISGGGLGIICINGEKAVKELLLAPDSEFSKWIEQIPFHSLSCRIDNLERGSDAYFHTFFTHRFPKFKHLTSLRLAAVYLDDHQLIKDSQPHIKELKLDNCYSTLNGFAMLVNNFPELTHLTLINIGHRPIPHEEVPPLRFNLLPQSPRKLSIGDFSMDSFPILDWIFSVPWDEVSVLKGKKTLRLGTQHFIDRASANVKCLDLQENYMPRPGKFSSLEPCKKLCELKICWNCDESILIRTVWSKEIQKIIITRSDALRYFTTNSYWEDLDAGLTSLVKQGRSLEVEIQAAGFPEVFGVALGREGDYLPNFRKHSGGRVKFLDPTGGIFKFPSRKS